ncbi:discoidin domain-containing protein [Candidatus Latescibacterota bacterium]
MLRYTKYCAMGLLLIVILFFLSVTSSQAAVQTVQTYTADVWSNTIYYIGAISGYYGQTQNYQDINLHITAVDDYELYVNGEKYDSANDGDWRTVDNYSINLGGVKDITIGVKVMNSGLGNGNGLVIGIDAGTDQIGTSTRVRESQLIAGAWMNIPVSWWTFDEDAKVALDFGDDWYNFNYSSLFADTEVTKIIRRAMLGSFSEQLDYNFAPGIEVITGYLHTGTDVGSTVGGGIKLRRIEGENIALNKPAQLMELTDGDPSSTRTISSPLNQTRYVDLGRIYSVTEMTIYTGGTNPDQFTSQSLRGYSVEISLDEYRWEEVGIIHEIGEDNEGGYDNYTVEFPEEWVRFVRFKITETRLDDPNIGEVMVYGVGYMLQASYESPWIDLGDPTTFKNFDMVEWEADIPVGTEVTIQTMTKAGATADSSGWSESSSDESFSFKSPEPATHFRYKVNFKTQDLKKTPVFTKFSVTYSEVDQPVTFAEGYITPNMVPMAEESQFLYTMGYELASGQDISELAIAVPSYSTLNGVYSTDAADSLAVTSRSTIDTLYVMFNPPITNLSPGGPDTLRVSFNSSLLRSSHMFDAYLFNSRMNDGAGGIKAWENIELGSNSVTVSTLVEGILDEVEAIPKVFTPNDDNINDFTVIEFNLAKVETNVLVKIFGTDGTLVTTLYDDVLPPSSYSVEHISAAISAARELPGYWDGKNEDGDLVPPGIYIYQVVAKTDEGDVTEGGTVVLAY